MVGKYAALATPILALAAIRVCSAARMSGRPFQQRRGQPGRHGGGVGLGGQGLAARHRPRRLPEEHAKLVLRLLDQALRIRE